MVGQMIQYPIEYFADEYREGFLVERTMKCAWAAQFEVLKRVEEICDRHGLKYFAFFGTLLGAARHGGYIPWDDDIDIAMLREDYQAFLAVCKEELPEEYCVLNVYDNEEWEEVNIRITNGDYIDISNKRMENYYGCPFAVGIDVYPLDDLPDDEKQKQYEQDLLQLIATTNGLLTQATETEDMAQREQCLQIAVNGLRTLEQVLGYSFDYDGNLSNQLFRLFDQVCISFSGKGSTYVTLMPTYVKGITKMLFLRDWFRETVELEFEQSTIRVPIGYEACLWARFGRNYMTPRQIQAAHDYPFYKEQRQLLEENGVWEQTDSLSRDIVKVLFGLNTGEENRIAEDVKSKSTGGKKIICYRISVVEFLEHGQDALEKMKRSFAIFRENSNRIQVLLVIDKQVAATLKITDTLLADDYELFLAEMEKAVWIQVAKDMTYDGIAWKCDAYYGDYNVLCRYFKKYGKPMMIESVTV